VGITAGSRGVPGRNGLWQDKIIIIIIIIINASPTSTCCGTNNPTQKSPEQKAKKWAAITYYGKESYQISKIFKNSSIHITYKTRNTLHYLLNQKPKQTNLYTNSGVYQLTCKKCKKTYTGQTGRNFDTRLKEHLQAYKYNPLNSKFAQHSIEYDHPYGNKTDIMTIKFIGRKSKFLDTMEKYYIYHETKANNKINDKNTVSYNKIFETILENQKAKENEST
jgi:hypothetical protein